MKWQPIETWRTPLHEDFAIVYAKVIDDLPKEKPVVQEALWDGKTWRCLYLGEPMRELVVTHWMPLPEKPE